MMTQGRSILERWEVEGVGSIRWEGVGVLIILIIIIIALGKDLEI